MKTRRAPSVGVKRAFAKSSIVLFVTAMVVCLSTSAQNPSQLVWGSYIGGALSDGIRDGIVDNAGNLIVVGWTDSTDFPVTPGAFQTTSTGPGPLYSSRVGESGYVMKFSPIGGLIFSTYFGGDGYENIMGVALDPAGNICIAGTTTSANMPVTAGAYDTTYNGGNDAFLAKLTPDGSTLLFCTYLGGTGDDQLQDQDVGGGIALDALGNIYITGTTWSADFPATAGAFDTTANGGKDGFAAKFSPDGSALLYATYLGGSAGDTANDCAVSSAGEVCIAGATGSSDFPTTAGAFQPLDAGGGNAAFVLKLTSNGSSLIFGTYIGGTTSSECKNVVVNPLTSEVYVSGRTSDVDFPVTGSAYDTTLGGGFDGFIAKLSPDGASLLAATLLGGEAPGESALNIAIDNEGHIWTAGDTKSTGFPTTAGAYQVMNASESTGDTDCFASRLSPDLSSLEYSTYVGGGTYDPDGKVVPGSDGSIHVLTLCQSEDILTSHGALDSVYGGNTDAYVAKIDPNRSVGLYEVVDLSTLGGNTSYATGINESGQVSGFSETPSGNLHAFRWQEGAGLTDLQTLGGAESQGWGINDAGEVVGESFTASGTLHAFYWNGTTMVDIDPKGGASSPSSSGAWAINNVDQVVGWSDDGITSVGFLNDLLTTGIAFGPNDSEAWDISSPDSNHGTRVALHWPDVTPGTTFPAIYDVDTDTVVGLPGLGGSRARARGINQRGLIVGWGQLGGDVATYPLYAA